MGVATLAFPWETTPLGAMSTWGESLRQIVRMCFSTRFPVLIAWGPDLTMIYNDAYREMLGTQKGLSALGSPLAQVWEEIWDEIVPLVEQVMTTRLPVWMEDTPLLVNRSGFLEETFFTFSYSPLVDDSGDVVGILDIATETTEQVVTRRRLTLIDTLRDRLQQTPGPLDELATTAAAVLSGGPDIGRCAIFGRPRVGTTLFLAGDAELTEQVPDDLVRQVMSTRTSRMVGSTLLTPLTATQHGDAEGVLAAQAASTRPFEASLRSLADLAAQAITGALRSAIAQQIELDYRDARARVAELEIARARESSVALQQSLLTPPPEPDHLHVVVRYQPAALDLEIGGDWYDAFLTKDGATTLVIGDVAGHDYRAAASMGQLRGLIRAIAYDSALPPSQVLERSDQAIEGLNLGSASIATVVLARIEQTLPEDTPGRRTVRWSNAGHPHPIIVRADGSVEVLARKNDLLLGVLPTAERRDHTVTIDNGDTLVFYTDGLIERRGAAPEDSLAALRAALHDAHLVPVDDLATHLLETLAPGHVDDDVALVLIRPYPEDEPRPAEAGPNKNVPDSVE
ncbi:SpoIIE family protein phosphatase [Sanguibacter sp. 25GB23B1]